jgi:Mn2+/Fe2+ NRAMP family transporter
VTPDETGTAAAAELATLRALAGEPWPRRVLGSMRLLGPGYLQSALTLGGGTAASALYAGAVFGVKLLWVAPVAMAMGVVMLAAVSWQTLSSGERPFAAMRRHAGPFFAFAWAGGALLASMVWHVPQYALASAVLADLGDLLGAASGPPLFWNFVVLAWALAISSLYGRSPRWVRAYERALQTMVWGIVVCFGVVVLRTGIVDWGALARGFFAFEIPAERSGVAGATLVLSGLSAAVGVNMLFLYPYSLRTRGWGREHRELARLDLLLGTFVPYCLAVSLVVIATANTLHLDPAYDGTRLTPVEAAHALAAGIGPLAGRAVFALGVLGMALSSISLQMLCCGFVCSEVLGWEPGSRRWRLATLLPTPAAIVALWWSDVAIWVAVPTNIVCGFLLPAAYVGFIRLQRSHAYLGDDRPSGARGALWLAAMTGVTGLLIAFLVWFAWGALAG